MRVAYANLSEEAVRWQALGLLLLLLVVVVVVVLLVVVVALLSMVPNAVLLLFFFFWLCLFVFWLQCKDAAGRLQRGLCELRDAGGHVPPH